MTRNLWNRFAWLVALNALGYGVLSFQQVGSADPGDQRPARSIDVQQRAEMIALLKEINAELKIQTALRQSGALPSTPLEPKNR